MLVPLSHPVTSNTPLYPGTSKFNFAPSRSESGISLSSEVRFNTHTGTHLDVPSHFCKEGRTVEEVIETYNEIYPVICLDVPAAGTVGLLPPSRPLSHDHSAAQGVLIRTGAHSLRSTDPGAYSGDHPYMTISLASWLLTTFPHLRVVGLDTISVGHPDHREEGGQVHRALLCREPPVLIVEDMDLSSVALTDGVFRLIIVPVLYDRLDGTPVTALALLP